MRPDREHNLDRELRDLGPRLEYPSVPDLARSVRGRLVAERAEGEGRGRHFPPWTGWAIAAALVLLVAVPVFSLAVRDTGSGAFSASGGAAGGAGGGAVEENREGAGDVAEQAAPSSPAAESGASSSVAPGSSTAACASPAPVLEARPARGAPGDAFRVRGKHFVAGFSVCDDTGPDLSAAQTIPARDVRVEFRQGGRTWELGRVEADKDSRLAARLEVPTNARPGRATVRATYGYGPAEAPYGRVSAEARFSVLDGDAAPLDK